MFAPGISRLVFARLGRQWPVVRAFFLKKSEARNSSPGIIQRDTAATEAGPPNTPKNAKKIRSGGWKPHFFNSLFFGVIMRVWRIICLSEKFGQADKILRDSVALRMP